MFDKDVFWRQIDGVNTEPCRYDVEYGNKPFQINCYYEDGVNRGILEFRGGDLVICETEAGNMPRPGEFTSSVGNRYTLVFHKRVS